MVRRESKEGRIYFVCEECGLCYEKKQLAERCQEWCKKHKSCNLEIIRHAVDI